MESKKHKVNINRKNISSEEIASNSNFSSLMSNYNILIKPFYKTGWFTTSIIITTVVAATTILYFQTNKNIPTEDTHDYTYQYNKEKEPLPRFINPPINNINIERTIYTVNPNKRSTLKHKTGSNIKIPKNAFIDKDGNNVNDNIEIHYREFHNVDDIFIAGIPMQYDSAGSEYHFETAGMLEILAYKDGEAVFIKPRENIEINMASYNDDPNFNLYYLDTNKRNWTYKGKDKINKKTIEKKTKNITNEIASIREEIKEIKKTKPVKPQKADETRFHFNIDVDNTEFPEIAVYKNMQFEIAPEDKNYSTQDANVIWEDVVIYKGKKENSYLVKFVKGKRTVEYSTYPVFLEKDYGDAKAIYDEKFNDYSQKLQERKDAKKRKEEEYENLKRKMKEEKLAREKKWEEESLARQQKWKKQQKMEFQRANIQGKISRTFTVNSFGYWNCDKPNYLPKGASVIAQFIDTNRKKIKFQQVYLVEKDRKAIFTYYNNAFNKFKYNPENNNMVYGITTDNKLAICNYDDFGNSLIDNGRKTFVMKIIDSNFETIEDIKEVLNI